MKTTMDKTNRFMLSFSCDCSFHRVDPDLCQILETPESPKSMPSNSFRSVSIRHEMCLQSRVFEATEQIYIEVDSRFRRTAPA